MKGNAQKRWALVLSNGFISHNYISFTRRGCIAELVKVYRSFRTFDDKSNLTDAQFWRFLKRSRGFSVRRITMRVVRR